jgi:hypothetical protein
MPNNTQDGYANAFLGDFTSYTEGRIVGNYWYTDIEAFIQDNWRVSRRVTLDLGIRFYHQQPTESLDYNTTVGSAPHTIRRRLCGSTTRTVRCRRLPRPVPPLTRQRSTR